MKPHAQLEEAIEAEDLAAVEALLAKQVDLGRPFRDGELPLTRAALTGNVQLVQLLLKRGADVNRKPKNGSAALGAVAGKFPAKRGLAKVVAELIRAGADVELTNDVGLTPLQCAASGESPEHLEIVRQLLAAGADVEAGQATTPLMGACLGTVDAVRMLLDAGADVNARRPRGTALLMAVEENRPEIVRLLLEHGADTSVRTDPDDEDYPDLPLLDFARKKRARKVVELLEAHGGASPRKSRNAESVDQVWAEIVNALDKRLRSSLAAGATAKALGDAEERLGIAFPDVFRHVWGQANGQKSDADPLVPAEEFLDEGYRLMSLKEIVAAWREQLELLEAGEFDTRVIGAGSGVRKQAWNRGWIPFADNGSGDFLCLDFAPSRGGKAGQVIAVGHESARRRLLATGFDTWLPELREALRSKD